MKMLQIIRKEWKPFAFRFFFLIFIAILSAFLRTAIPYFYKFIIDDLNSGAPIKEIYIYIKMIIIIGVSRFIIYSYFQSNRAMMNMHIEWFIRRRAFKKLLKVGRLSFQKISTGEIVTRLTDDAEKLSWFLSSGVFRGLDAILIFALTIYYLIILSPILTLITFAILIFLVISMFLLDKILHKKYMRLQKSISEVNDYINSSLNGIGMIKSFNRENKFIDYFKKLLLKRNKAEISVAKADVAVRGLYMSLHSITTILVIFVGGGMVIHGKLTIGTFIAFMSYTTNLINPVLDIGTLFVRGKKAAVSAERIYELENLPAFNFLGKENVKFEKKIELTDISFEIAHKKILENIGITLKKGEKIAIMGKIGSGKSFFTKMLAGLLPPTSGNFLIDGKNIKDIDIVKYRALIGFAPQQAIVLSDTIKNNILLGDKLDEKRFEYAISVSQFKKEMEKFGLGMDTIIGPKGKTLSGGQKQRLALARALYRKPEILILDDVTSALDAETEMKFWESLFKSIPEQTLILVTHRPKTAEIVDRIYLLNNGKIEQTGTHRELIGQKGLYREIYET